MKVLRKIWMGLILPIEAIISVAVLIDESRRLWEKQEIVPRKGNRR
jgi:hypothetical protein